MLESTYQIEVGALSAPVKPGRVASGLMEQTRRLPHRIAMLCVAGDALTIVVSLMAAFWMRFYTPVQHWGVAAPGMLLADYLNYICFGTAALVAVLAHRGMYNSRRLLQRASIPEDVITTGLIWGMGFLGFALLFKFEPPLSRVYTGLATVTTIGGLLGWRWTLSHYLRQEGVISKLQQRILILGWNEHSMSLRAAIESDPSHACEVVCCVPPPGRGYQQPPPKDLLVAEDYGDLPGLLNSEAIDIVLVADLDAPTSEICELATLCEKEMVQFKVMPSYFNVLVSGLSLETISGIPLLGVSQLPLDRPFCRVAKRMLDVAGAMVGLILSAPLIAIFGTLVYLESPGSIFYSQRRVGRNGKTFQIFKIRSMKLNAEVDGKAGWSTREDSRRLRIGSWMRKWNIDEVPQFWNVLAGDMSLVGPRPERPELIRNFKHEIAHYNARHAVKPGITGWAQVNGLRGDTDLSERIRYDLFYVENWSLLFDLRLLITTLFTHKNAC